MIVLSNLGKTSTLGEMKTMKFKPSELGHIPAEWEVKSLGELWDDFRTGPFGSALHAQDYVTGGTPLINPMHIQDGKICPTSDMSVDKATEQRLSIYRLSKDDIIIGRRGEMGRAALVREEEAGWLCGTGCFFLRMKDVMSPDFVTRYLRTPTCVSVLEGEAVGTTLVNLNQAILGRVNVPVPPLSEQRKIATALSDVDEMIAALEKLIEKKRMVKTGAMQRLLTGKTRLPGFKGAWVEKCLGELGYGVRGVGYKPWQSGTSPMVGRVQLLRSNNVQDGRLNFNDVVYVDECCVSDGQRMRVGDILICAANGSRNLVGKAAPLLVEREVTFGAFMSVFRCHDNNQAAFVGHLLNSGTYKQKLDDILTGSAINNLNVSDIEDMRFFVPPTLAEQKAIAKVLGDMDEEIAALEAELAKAHQLKQGMMQELLTGKVRLG